MAAAAAVEGAVVVVVAAAKPPCSHDLKTSRLRCGFATSMMIVYEYSQRKFSVRSCIRKYHEIVLRVLDAQHVHNAATRSVTLKTSRLRYGFVTSMTKSMNTSTESILYEAVPGTIM